MTIKEEFHNLIDSIEDEGVLKDYYQLIYDLNDDGNGELWQKLSQDQKIELLIADDECERGDNLISHEDAKKEIAGWLQK